eukprot:m.80308 g.80308  ORF g.80308 m.80308 type:complete len:386 (+) comp14840_c0_seq3:63-1220(+)
MFPACLTHKLSSTKTNRREWRLKGLKELNGCNPKFITAEEEASSFFLLLEESEDRSAEVHKVRQVIVDLRGHANIVLALQRVCRHPRVVLLQQLLGQIGDGGGVVGWEADVDHGANQAVINKLLCAPQCNELVAALACKVVHVVHDGRIAEAVAEVNGRTHGEVGAVVVGALVREGQLEVSGSLTLVVDGGRVDQILLVLGNVEDGRAFGRVEPLVAVGRVEVGANLLHVDRDLAHGVCTVEEDHHAMLVAHLHKLLHRQDEGGHRRDVREDGQANVRVLLQGFADESHDGVRGGREGDVQHEQILLLRILQEGQDVLDHLVRRVQVEDLVLCVGVRDAAQNSVDAMRRILHKYNVLCVAVDVLSHARENLIHRGVDVPAEPQVG